MPWYPLSPKQSRSVLGHVGGPAVRDAGGVEGVRVVAGTRHRVTDIDQPPGGVGHHLHVEPALVVLVREHVRLGVGAFPGRGDESVHQQRRVGSVGLDLSDQVGVDRTEQRVQPGEQPRDRGLGTAEQLTGHVLGVVVAQQEQGQHHRPVQPHRPGMTDRGLPYPDPRGHLGDQVGYLLLGQAGHTLAARRPAVGDLFGPHNPGDLPEDGRRHV